MLTGIEMRDPPASLDGVIAYGCKIALFVIFAAAVVLGTACGIAYLLGFHPPLS